MQPDEENCASWCFCHRLVLYPEGLAEPLQSTLSRQTWWDCSGKPLWLSNGGIWDRTCKGLFHNQTGANSGSNDSSACRPLFELPCVSTLLFSPQGPPLSLFLGPAHLTLLPELLAGHRSPWSLSRNVQSWYLEFRAKLLDLSADKVPNMRGI